MQSSQPAEAYSHSHTFDTGNPLAERNTRWAVLLTACTMVVEILGGWYYNSMALLADGWHMSSHALALGLSVMAYAAARRLAHHKNFSFGTWKIEVLGGYTSAIFLVGIAALMLFQSTQRLLAPTPIQYEQAIAIAIVGLLVNLVCAWLLKDNHTHHHTPSHDHSHGHSHKHASEQSTSGHHHHDLNQRAAFLHVLTDAATSLLAILALTGGKLWGAAWLDPVMGIVGAGLVSIWAYGLLRETGRVLMDAPVVSEIREVLASGPTQALITDLHVWRVGTAKYACIVSILTPEEISPQDIRQQLSVHEELVHITVEVNSGVLQSG
jgi:cation diffusion facilitator family transporter